MPNIKKHRVANLLADRINRKEKVECVTPEDHRRWHESYAIALNTLSTMEDLDNSGIVTFNYKKGT